MKIGRDNLSSLLFAAAGFSLLCWLLLREDLHAIVALFTLVGVNLVWIASYRGIPIAIDALGWQRLYLHPGRPAFKDFFRSRWLAESVNTLLPVVQVGGHLLRARVIGKKYANGEEAGATVMVDFTIGLVTQLFFTIIGLLLLLQQTTQHFSISGIIIGIGVALAAISGFIGTQKAGIFSLGGKAAKQFLGNNKGQLLQINAKKIDMKVREVYCRKKKLLQCFIWRLVGWLIKSGEIWLFFYFAGVPVTIIEAIILESISTAIRSAAFFVPHGLGVQDGSLLVIGSILGLHSPNIMALALAKRFRELIIGIPGILWWLKTENRLLRK